MKNKYKAPNSGSIAFMDTDGSIVQIYCHNANPEEMACDLIEFYDTEEKVINLVSSGSIERISKIVDDCRPYAKWEGTLEIGVFLDFDSYATSTTEEIAFHYIFIDQKWYIVLDEVPMDLMEFLEIIAESD